MSTRIDGGARGAPLAEDDDWFAAPPQQAVEQDDLQWENELEWHLRDPAPPDIGRRQAAIVLAVVVAVFLVVAGILIGRATKSSSTKVVTAAPVSQVQETPATTGAGDSSAETSTPSTSTGTTSSTGSTPSTSTSSTSTTSTSTTSTSAVPTDAALRGGAKGASVIALQNALTTLGYPAGTADGTYGATTAQAVTAFQTAKNLTADGVAGAKTLAAINAALASG
jgi:murein L,D-transpeptidase YcbB/YkuD